MSAVWAEVGKGSQPIPNGAFFFLHKRISLSVVLNTNIANSSNRSFIPPIFVEPGTVPGMGDSAGNKIDRSPALTEFAFWRVGGGRVRRAEPHVQCVRGCGGRRRRKPDARPLVLKVEASRFEADFLRGPQSSRCVSLLQGSGLCCSRCSLPQYGLCPSTPFSLPEIPSAHASVGESLAVCCSPEVSGQLLGPPPWPPHCWALTLGSSHT